MNKRKRIDDKVKVNLSQKMQNDQYQTSDQAGITINVKMNGLR